MLATARYPIRTNGLAIRRTAGGLAFSVGRETFARIESPSGSPGDACVVRLTIDGNRWTIRSPSGELRTGDLDRPIVTGFFTELDLRRGARPSIALTTEPFGTRARAHQRIAWILATLCALAALSAVSASQLRPRFRRRVAIQPGKLARSLRPPDLFVAVLLPVWWVIGPTLYDDGWVKVRQTNYDISGGFSNYYSSYGVNLPLDFWVEWVQHWVVGRFTDVLVLRTPALVLLAATWVVCRWTFSRLIADAPRAGRGALWALAIAFTLCALAWDMTLRPEPVVALLVVGVVACAVRFVERPGPVPVTVAALLVVLALTAHPAGLISIAPLLAVSPAIIRWVRVSGWVAPTAIGLAALALLLVLVTVGSDLQQRADDARVVRLYGDATASWREELNRYVLTGTASSTMRRESVALMLVAVLAYVVRRGRMSRPLLDVPAASLGIAIVLMIATPSKWIWHFGVFAGLAALAVAAELAALRERATGRWAATPFVALGAIVLVVGWAWWPRIGWGDFDLRTLDWVLPLEDRITLVRLTASVPVALLVAAMVIQFVRHGWKRVGSVPWSFLPWLVPLAVLPVIGFTVTMLVRDAMKTPSWTLPRQNLESLRGSGGCGLADDTQITQPTSTKPIPPTASSLLANSGSWTPTAPVSGLQRFSLFGGETTATTPWYALPADGRRSGFFFLNGTEVSDEDFIEARWGRQGPDAVRPLATERVSLPAFEPRKETTPWLFVPQGWLPKRPTGADAVQLVLRSTGVPPQALATTGVVSYRTANLSSLLTSGDARALVWPNLVLFMPCARLPRLGSGIVGVPTVLIGRSGQWPIEFETSPFRGVLDLYPVRDLSVGDSEVEPEAMNVLWVDRRIPGAAVAQPVARPA